MNCFCKTRLRVQESPVVRFSQDQYIKIRAGDYDPYTGDYIVIPSAEERVLDTDHKLLLDDVTVTAIPYVEVGNESGGYTVSIG